MDTIEVNGEKYQKIRPNGNRAVVVVDRGWIFAGDLTDVIHMGLGVQADVGIGAKDRVDKFRVADLIHFVAKSLPPHFPLGMGLGLTPFGHRAGGCGIGFVLPPFTQRATNPVA